MPSWSSPHAGKPPIGTGPGYADLPNVRHHAEEEEEEMFPKVRSASDADSRTALTAAGAVPVLLGRTVLRSSTAGPAAIAVVQQLLGRFGSRP